MRVVWLDTAKGAYQELSSIIKPLSQYLARPRAFQYKSLHITQQSLAVKISPSTQRACTLYRMILVYLGGKITMVNKAPKCVFF